jgi:hypothetical protein
MGWHQEQKTPFDDGEDHTFVARFPHPLRNANYEKITQPSIPQDVASLRTEMGGAQRMCTQVMNR